MIPGVLYGHGIDPTPVAVNARSLRAALNTTAGLNALLQLELEGKRHLALARDIQKHPVRNAVSHVDFQVVGRDEMMAVDVPLNFIGDAENVTRAGGMVEHLLQSLAVLATPSSIPTHLDVDVSKLELDDAIRVKDIALPDGVTSSLDPEEAVVVGKSTRGAMGADEDEVAAGEGEATTES
jgi:large subunit ribosomal protein L25